SRPAPAPPPQLYPLSLHDALPISTRVLTLDLHAAQIQGFFDIPVDHLFAMPVMIEYFKSLEIPSLTVVSPDAGGVERARAFAKRDRKSTRLNSSHVSISYAVFCLK